jgi:pimeloyl-ACP methyl ester carboxylesterase
VPQGHVEIDAGRLWYEIAGEGPTVVLIHSGLADARQWDDQMRTFTRRYRVIRYDQRAYGRSEPPRGRYSSVDDLSRLLDALDVGSAALVGVSQGAGIALSLALERPELAWAVVAAAPGAVGYDGWSEEMEEAGDRMDAAVDRGDIRGALRIARDLWVPPGRFPDTDGMVAQLLAGAEEAWRIPDDLEQWPEPRPLERLQDLKAPTLVVEPEHDPPDYRDVRRLIGEGIPGARMVTIPETDHQVNVRNPAGFDRAVLDFLQEVAP